MDQLKNIEINYINILKEHGYQYISGEHINLKSEFKCYDEEGYIVYPRLDNLNSKQQRFHKNNLDVEYNIRYYLELHPECECLYVSGKYENSKSILTFRCKCGNLFQTTFNNVRQNKKRKCDKCTGYTKNLSFDKIKENLKSKGYFLQINKNDFKGITLSPLTCIDKDGYLYDVVYDQIMRDHFPFPIAKSNKYAIKNINLYLDKKTNKEYVCLSDTYNGKGS